jgi:uncharacterized membrane protein
MEGSFVASVTESITVNCPNTTVYDQWTQFEEFPRFMEGVESVTQTDDTHLHWVAEIAGKRHEWDAELTEQRPDEVLAWRALDGHYSSGRVHFERIDDNTTKVSVEMEHKTEGMVEALGSALGFDSRQVKADLERFKEHIESRGTESGAWRGEVQSGERVR